MEMHPKTPTDVSLTPESYIFQAVKQKVLSAVLKQIPILKTHSKESRNKVRGSFWKSSLFWKMIV